MYCKKIFNNWIKKDFLNRFKKLLNFNKKKLIQKQVINENIFFLNYNFIVKNKNFYINNKQIIFLIGRVILKRYIGKICFLTIINEGLLFQICISYKYILDFILIKQCLDIGDLILIKGFLFETNTFELTLMCIKFNLILKSLKLIPIKNFFLKEKTNYQERCLDLILNKNNFLKLKNRYFLIKLIKLFMNNKNFIEVETPILQDIVNGANAIPFITYYKHLHKIKYLRISPELFLKKLIVSGFNRIFEIGKNFRNEGLSSIHQPEFTMMEMYITYQSFQYLISFTEYLIKYLCLMTNKYIYFYKNKYINLHKPFYIISMKNSINFYLNINVKLNNRYDLLKIIFNYNIPYNYLFKYGYMLNTIFEILIQKRIIHPTFIIDYPIEISPLAKKKNKNFSYRFELFLFGIEIANGFYELNNPQEQLHNFLKQILELNKNITQIDFEFINSIYYGLPPTCGLGIGIDRLIMLLTQSNNIKNILSFYID